MFNGPSSRSYPEEMEVVRLPTPTKQQLAATAVVEQSLESSMEIHRASPAVVNSQRMSPRSKPPPPAYKPKTSNHSREQGRSGVSVHDLAIPPPPGVTPHSQPPAVPTDLNSSFSSEVAYFNGFMDDVHFDAKDKKKSKLPWKKNKGRYTPTKEIEKQMQQMNKGLRSDSRTGSWSSLNSDIPHSSGNPSQTPNSKEN